MMRSLTRAWAPVPLKGQSRRTTPRRASTLRAASFTGIGSVLVSITIAPRPADCESSTTLWERASAEGSEVTMFSARRATARHDVEPGHAKSRARQIRRHRRAHDSETDHSHRLPLHCIPLFLLVR